MSDGNFFDCTRLTDQNRRALIGSLSRSAPARADSRRQSDRFEYTVAAVPVTVFDDQGSPRKFLMHARNISCGGLSVLHGGYLHKKTRCSIMLQSLDGRRQVVSGQVADCRHITKNIHEVCIRFFEKITLDAFCGADAKVCSPIVRLPGTPMLKGLALCLSKPAEARRRFLDWLSATGLDAVDAQSVGAAADKLKRLPFVVAVVDAEEGDWDASSAVKTMRDSGFAGGIIVVRGSSENVEGADETLSGSPDVHAFNRVLGTLQIEKAGEEGRPVHSTLANAAESRSLIAGFVEHALGVATLAESAVKTNDRDRLIDALRSLKSTAGGYGFGVVGQAAAGALTAIERAKTLKHAERQIALVVSLCRRLSAEPAGARAA